MITPIFSVNISLLTFFRHFFPQDRLWRKTRSPQGLCYGVDPNRNWGFHWNGELKMTEDI